MPATKEQTTKNSFNRNASNSGMSMSARVYHPATNLMPPSPPLSPTAVTAGFNLQANKNNSTASISRQNSQTGSKYTY